MKRRLFLWGAGALSLLFVSVLVSLSLGSASVSITDIAAMLLSKLPFASSLMDHGWADADEKIVLAVRLPRVALAVLVGAALSAAGAGFQGVLRNPLADPYTLGVASGASVGAAFMILFKLQYAIGQWTIPLAAFGTGLLALAAVLQLARREGKAGIETLVLAGVIVQAFLGSLVSLMVSMSNSVVNEIVYWLMGSLSMRGWAFSQLMIPYLALGLGVLLFHCRALNLLALGERQAAHAGVELERTRLTVLVVSTLMTAAAISVSGIVGFVGLVVPHLVRLTVGPDYRLIAPLSAIVGGIYVLWADTLSRTVLSPKEIPLGVVTAMLGAPFFAYLLRRIRYKH